MHKTKNHSSHYIWPLLQTIVGKPTQVKKGIILMSLLVVVLVQIKQNITLLTLMQSYFQWCALPRMHSPQDVYFVMINFRVMLGAPLVLTLDKS